MTSSTTPSADTWVYDHLHSVYFHPLSNTYAIPDPSTGQWSYTPAAEFHSASSSRCAPPPTQSIDEGQSRSKVLTADAEKEEGEIEDDVGWGGLMDPDKLDTITKGQKVNSNARVSTHNLKSGASTPNHGLEKNPVYVVPYDDPTLYSFPSDEVEANTRPKERPNHILRLVVVGSECLEAGQVAVLDTREDGIQIGRDRCEKGGRARVRLKEMQVSKTHAVVYWGKGGEGAQEEGEGQAEGWWVVDLGSTHGTFVSPPHTAGSTKKPKAIRLSEAKHSSVPHQLHHLSTLSIGSTTLSVHVHLSWPCDDCKLKGTNEIALDDGEPKKMDAATTEEVESDVAGKRWAMDSKQKRENREMKRKREMALLRETLLNRDSSPSNNSAIDDAPAREYLDRSAMRRRLHPPSPPSKSSPPTRLTQNNDKGTTPRSAAAEPSGPSAFASSMLVGQGWTPGQGLGKNAEGRAEAVEAEMRTKRRGLGAEGSKAVPDGGEGDWKMRGKQRRWEQVSNQ